MITIQKLNYIPNTLRKNRTEAFEADIEAVFETYSELVTSVPSEQVTVGEFADIWANHNMQFIYQCLQEEESEDQFAQLMYEVILKKYFYLKPKGKKVFAIFALYFLYYACENRKRISISPEYLNELKTFLLQHRNESASHYAKITYQLHIKCFSVCTKLGLRNPIVKSNGQPPRKALIVRTDPVDTINKIEEQIRDNPSEPSSGSLKSKLSAYEALKNQILSDASYNKQKFPLDVHFSNRVGRLVRNYKEFVASNDRSKKKQQQMD